MASDEQKAVDAKAAADKKALEQAEKDHKAAADAANAVPVVVTGDPILGGPANIYGSGFGSKGGLTIGGRPIDTSVWTDTRIHFNLPPGVKGDVVLTTGEGVRRGTFPHVPPTVTETTTVTVKTS